jgi:hypothetical protein
LRFDGRDRDAGCEGPECTQAVIDSAYAPASFC